MSEERKLPVVFWFLLLAAGVVALILVVGILLENQSFFANLFPSSPKTKEKVSAPNTPTNKGAPPNRKCSVKEVAIAGPQRRLGFWDPDPYNLSFWTLDPREQQIERWDVADDGRDLKATLTHVKQPLRCKDRQEEGCVFPGPQNFYVKSANLLHGTGWLELVDRAGTITPVWARMQNGKLRIYQKLGLCGKTLAPSVRLSMAYQSDTPWLIAHDDEGGFVMAYAPFALRGFSGVEAPQHPEQAFIHLGESLREVDCNSAHEGQAFTSFSVLADRAALLTNSGRLSKQPLVRQFQLNREGLKSTGKIAGDALGSASLDHLSWLGSDLLAVTHHNFFRTQAQSWVIEPRQAKLRAWEEGGENVPRGVWLSREEAITKRPQGRLQASQKTADKGNLILRTENGWQAELPVYLTYDKNPVGMVAQRSPERYFVLAQAHAEAPIQGFVLNCVSE